MSLMVPNIYKHLLMSNHTLNGIFSILASGDIAAGFITASAGNISSFSGNIHKIQGTAEGKNGAFENIACTGLNTLTVPESRRIFRGLDADAAGGIDIFADTNQCIDSTTMLNIYKGRFIYNAAKQ